MISGEAASPAVLATREPDRRVAHTLSLVAWRRSSKLRRSHEACFNCERAFRSELWGAARRAVPNKCE